MLQNSTELRPRYTVVEKKVPSRMPMLWHVMPYYWLSGCNMVVAHPSMAMSCSVMHTVTIVNSNVIRYRYLCSTRK